MSQIYKSLISGPVPPSVATSYVTDVNSPAVPVANILNLIGDDTTTNNINGIQTDGSSGGNTVTVQLTNRFRQTTTTSGAIISTMIILSGLAAGIYTLDMKIAAFATTGGPTGNGYTLVGAVRSDGAAAVLLPDQALDSFEENIAATATLNISGNSIIVTVTGAAGIDYNWAVVGEYMFIS